MDFDGNQPIRILFVTTGLKKENRKKQQNIKDRNNEENMIKMHVHCLRSYCDYGKGKISKMSKKLIWTNEIIEEWIELLFCPF
jgi:hypothetical protein